MPVHAAYGCSTLLALSATGAVKFPKQGPVADDSDAGFARWGRAGVLLEVVYSPRTGPVLDTVSKIGPTLSILGMCIRRALW